MAGEGLHLTTGAGGVSNDEMPAFEARLGLPAIHRSQAGLLADMDYVADVLYNRTAKRAEPAVAVAAGA